ncbi:MAG: hypothetical protein ACJ752_04305 [Gaiellaceae bacterium]
MNSNNRQNRAIARNLIALGFVALVTTIALAVAARARADSRPVGALPPGPVSTSITAPKQLVAIAMPRASTRSGLVWRLARHYDSHIVRQISEANVGPNVIVVFSVVGRGDTSLVFALTRGDKSANAIKAVTHKVRSR